MVAHGGSWRSPTTSVMPRPGSSVVERGPEKAGVGGSIPSLATIVSISYKPPFFKVPTSRESFGPKQRFVFPRCFWDAHDCIIANARTCGFLTSEQNFSSRGKSVFDYCL